MGDISADVDRFVATIRGVTDRLAGAVHVEIHPTPDAREDSAVTNRAVLRWLAERNPALVALSGGDIDRSVRQAARAVYRPGMGLGVLATAAAPEVARAIAARLRSGAYVSNNDETRRRKNGRPGGVDTGALAESLDNATVTLEG